MYSPRNEPPLSPDIYAEFQYLSGKLRAWSSVDHNEDGTHNLRPSGFDFVPIGTIMAWGTNTAPERWLILDGAAKSRTTYQSLFQLWGTTFGSGDGSSTFNIPNLQQRFPMGKAASGTGATLGDTGGSIDHTHGFSGGTTGANGGFSTSTGAGGSHDHTGATGADPGQATVQIDAGGPSPVSVSLGPHTHAITAATDHTHSLTVGDHTHTLGSGSTDADNPPYLVLNYIVLAGV